MRAPAGEALLLRSRQTSDDVRGTSCHYRSSESWKRSSSTLLPIATASELSCDPNARRLPSQPVYWRGPRRSRLVALPDRCACLLLKVSGRSRGVPQMAPASTESVYEGIQDRVDVDGPNALKRHPARLGTALSGVLGLPTTGSTGLHSSPLARVSSLEFLRGSRCAGLATEAHRGRRFVRQNVQKRARFVDLCSSPLWVVGVTPTGLPCSPAHKLACSTTRMVPRCRRRGAVLTTISTSWPRRVRSRMRRSLEKLVSRPFRIADTFGWSIRRIAAAAVCVRRR